MGGLEFTQKVLWFAVVGVVSGGVQFCLAVLQRGWFVQYCNFLASCPLSQPGSLGFVSILNSSMALVSSRGQPEVRFYCLYSTPGATSIHHPDMVIITISINLKSDAHQLGP